ncbi:MAG: tRNA lysidine(34) synthetase TilS [Bacillota bacterium]
MLLQEVKRTVDSHRMLETGTAVVVGVSGGPDSVALLHVLASLREQYDLSLHTAHLNHLMRGEEAKEDANYVRHLATSLGAGFTACERDIRRMARDEGLSEEQVGRRERYKMYLEVAASLGASRVALGHNRDDQAETVLMRFLRGAGVEGLSGIPPARDLAPGVRVIRPLINVPRHEIQAYCRLNGLATRFDSTNLDPGYLRNRLRHEILPFLEKELNPGLRQVLARTAEVCREDADYLGRRAEEALSRVMLEPGDDELRLSAGDLREMMPALRRRVLRAAIEEACGGLQGICFSHIADIDRLITLGGTGQRLHLPGGVTASLDYGDLTLAPGRGAFAPPFSREVKVPGVTFLPEVDYVIETSVADRESVRAEMERAWSANVAFRSYFDYNKVVLPLRARSRLPGDSFRPLGLGGTKKVKDFFISEKVPRNLRGRVPLLVSGEEIAWIVGLRLSEVFKVTGNTKTVLIVTATPVDTIDTEGRADR